jgi:YVTN family beta-propeller protein
MAELPRGTVSLLFTDIEGSTQLQHRLQERYREVVNEHRRLLEEAIESHGGLVVDRQTESFFAAFPRMRDAVAAAADAQRAIAAHEWPESVQVKVRMGIHAGEPELEGDRYVGLAVARAARVANTAHGGQVLLSGAARGLLPERSRVRALGAYPLKDFESPEPLFQLEVDGLPDRFPRPRVTPKRSRRPLLVALGAALVAIVGAAVAAALVLGNAGGGLSLVRPNNVGVIDPATNKIVAEVPVGIRPGPVAFGSDAVWVGNIGDRTLTRIDASTLTGTGTISLDDRTPTGIAFGEGALWVAHGFLGRLSRVDPQFGRVTTTLELAGQSDTGAVAVGGGSIWAVFGESTVARIDPAAVRPTGEGFAGGSPAAIVHAAGALWTANSFDQTVSRFNPGSFEEGPVRTISVGRRPVGIAFGAGAIWVANSGDGTVTRIDPTSHSTFTIEVGEEPTDVVAGSDAIWVANRGGTISRIDPAKLEVVRTIDVGNAPEEIAFGGGHIWVTVQAT